MLVVRQDTFNIDCHIVDDNLTRELCKINSSKCRLDTWKVEIYARCTSEEDKKFPKSGLFRYPTDRYVSIAYKVL